MAERSSIGVAGVLGISLGVFSVAGAAAGLLRPTATERGPEAAVPVLERNFIVEGELPFGFTVQGLRRLTGGELYVTLAPEGGPPEEPDPAPFDGEIAEASKGKGGWGEHGGGERKRTEWEKVVVEAAAPPVEAAILVLEDSKERGDRLLTSQFAQVRFKDMKHLNNDEERVAVDSGHLDWGPYEVGWVRHRHYEKAEGVPTFHDTVRVNLSTGVNARVLYVRWSRGVPGDVEAAQALLEVYRPLRED